ncbi:hypothetical protein [Nocardioides sp. BYT-33-1]|jgi:hypothetical protein|uniref:hypothetical protein n=1 Tax=Nocardioides sp. BYT-33-1 TaxID=3416952 RepID=UPI003F5303C8
MTPVQRTVLRLAAAFAGATGLVLSGPGLASAADLVHTDPARDVMSATLPEDKAQPAPRERGLDIRKVRVSHGTEALVLHLRTRGRLPRKSFVVTGAVRTPGGVYNLEHMRFAGATESGLTFGDTAVPCPGFVTDRGRRTITFTIPTPCIGDPAWVRVGVGVVRFGAQRYTADDGFSRTVGHQLRLSPRLPRG